MACHAWCCSKYCMMSVEDDGLPCPTYSNHMCWTMSMTVCNTLHSLTVYNVKGRRWHAMPDVFPPFVRLRGEDGMSRPMSSDHVCFPMEMMAFHARRCPIVFVIQWQRWHVTPDVIWLRVLPNANDGMPCSTSSDYVCTIKGNVKLNGIKDFNHKIYYLKLNFAF